MKKLTIILLLLSALCAVTASAGGWKSAEYYHFYPGEITIEGRYVTADTAKMPRLLTFTLNDIILGRSHIESMAVNADGTFAGRFRLPHIQEVSLDRTLPKLLLIPGDTLRITADPSTGETQVSGSSAAGYDIQEVDSRIGRMFAGLPDAWKAGASRDTTQQQAFVRTLVAKLDSIYGSRPKEGADFDIVNEIITIKPLAHALSSLFRFQDSAARDRGISRICETQ